MLLQNLVLSMHLLYLLIKLLSFWGFFSVFRFLEFQYVVLSVGLMYSRCFLAGPGPGGPGGSGPGSGPGQGPPSLPGLPYPGLAVPAAVSSQ